jgi:uncharacterized protein YndB with AHSA1/START domain
MVSSGTAMVTLPTDENVLIVREFDAPKHLVYRVWTEPDLVRQWWHANRGEMTVCEIDLRPGGYWRYAMTTHEGGFEVGFHGTYREVVPNERLVTTEAFEGIPEPDENAVLNTITFTEVDGRTTVEILVECGSKEIRDAMVASGMEDGLQDALDLVEEVAVSLR